MKFIIITIIFVVLLLFPVNAVHADSIPTWIKQIAGWWVDGTIDDEEFQDAIQYILQNKIIYIDSELPISFQQTIAELEIKQKAHLVTTIMHLRSEIVKFLSELSEVQSFAILSSSYNNISSDNQFLKNNLSLKLSKFTETSKLIDHVRILDLSGMEILRINNIDGVSILTPDSELQDKSDRYYFQESIKLGIDDVYVSKVDLNEEHGQIEIPYNPTIRIASIIHNSSNEYVGILIVNYNLEEFLHEISESNFCNIVIFDSDGIAVHHYDKTKEFGLQTGTNYSYYDEHPELKQIEKENISWYVDASHDVTIFLEKITLDDSGRSAHFACELKLIE